MLYNKGHSNYFTIFGKLSDESENLFKEESNYFEIKHVIQKKKKLYEKTNAITQHYFAFLYRKISKTHHFWIYFGCRFGRKTNWCNCI
jgi:hypothetical protein